MNLLLRLPIYVKTQRVLPPGARRTASTTARPPVRAILSFRASRLWRRTFMNSPGWCACSAGGTHTRLLAGGDLDTDGLLALVEAERARRPA